MRALTAVLAVLMLLAVGFAAGTAQAQNQRSCPSDQTPGWVLWHNCFATYVYKAPGHGFRGFAYCRECAGVKIVGNYRNNLLDGQATVTWPDGTDHRNGSVDLPTVLVGSCAFIIHSSVFVVSDPRTFFLPALVGSFLR